jgi:hypothetical protein
VERAEARIHVLREKLGSPVPLRLKPFSFLPGGLKLERRTRHEAALARNEYVVARARFGRGGRT